MSPTKLPILILAAGRSSRMGGRDKLAEIIEGETLLRRTVRRALDTGHPVAVTLPDLAHPRAQMLEGLAVEQIAVPDAREGMNVSLRRGLVHFVKAEAVMILLADMPDLETEHLGQVFAAYHQSPDALVWRGATEDAAPGHPTLIARDLFERIIDLKGDVGAQPILRRAKTVLVPLPGQVARRDLDTPQAWAAWRAERESGNS